MERRNCEESNQVNDTIIAVLRSGATIIGKVAGAPSPEYVKQHDCFWTHLFQIVQQPGKTQTTVSYGFNLVAQFGDLDEAILISASDVFIAYYAGDKIKEQHETVYTQVRAEKAGLHIVKNAPPRLS